MKIFGDDKSGNCLKVRYTADFLSLPYEWQPVDIMVGESRSDEFLAMNPAGQVPCVVWPDGKVLAQSNAIIVYLAEGSSLLPQDPFAKAEVLQWLFWEQYSHEPNIAVCRFHRVYLGRSFEELDPDKLAKGKAALKLMNDHLAGSVYFVGDSLSVADIALYAYTHMAEEGGFDLATYPHVMSWLERVSESLETK